MRVKENSWKRLNFKLFILAILSNVMVMAQTATIPLTNSNAIVDNNPSQNAFYAQITPGSTHAFYVHLAVEMKTGLMKELLLLMRN